MDNPIFLDSASMHPILPSAREAHLSAPFGNPSSEHAVGKGARDALEQAREKIAKHVDADPKEVYFVSNSTEGAALALNSAWLKCYDIASSPYEHHAVSENIYRPLNIDAAPGTLWCAMFGNNEAGAIEPRPNMKKNDLLLCDATASVGHVPFSFREMVGNGYALADSLKFGGVPGAAFLIAKQGVPLSPLIRGGGQERGMRSGTENVPAIYAMAAALEWQTEHMEQTTERLTVMQGILVEELSKVPGHKWNTPLDKPHLPHILNISFDGVDAHTLALLLSNDGVMVSPGAACSNGLHEPSHVIMAMFNDEARARSAIRVSLSHENTPEECRIAAEKIAECVKHLRELGGLP